MHHGIKYKHIYTGPDYGLGKVGTSLGPTKVKGPTEVSEDLFFVFYLFLIKRAYKIYKSEILPRAYDNLNPGLYIYI